MCVCAYMSLCGCVCLFVCMCVRVYVRVYHPALREQCKDIFSDTTLSDEDKFQLGAAAGELLRRRSVTLVCERA